MLPPMNPMRCNWQRGSESRHRKAKEMKALSIQQPWSWLIVNGYKDIENRDWYTSYRGFVLIHAGKKLDPGCFDGDDLHSPGLYRMGAGLDIRAHVPLRKQEYETGGIVGYATLQKVVTASDNPWFRGKYGFVLTQRHLVDFISLRGQLGLFDVPASIEEQINAIRDERAYAEDAKDFNQIKREWYEYRHEGDETPPYYHR